MTDQITRPDIAAATDAAHRTLDRVDEGWHYDCVEPNEDGPSGCAKGHYARAMLEQDVMPAVVDALIAAGWLPPAQAEVAPIYRDGG